MITEAVMRAFGGFLSGLFGWIPDGLGVPDFLDVGLGSLMGVLSAAGSLSVWIPIPLVVLAIGFRFAVLFGAITVKSVRVVLSLFTGGGGSAA